MNPFPRLVAYTVVILALYAGIVFAFTRWAGMERIRLEALVRQSAVPGFGAAMDRVAASERRVVIILMGTGAGAMAVLVILAAISVRSSAQAASRTPWIEARVAARTEMAGLTELAKTSAAQGEELDRERTVRQRAEQDSAMKEQLLAYSRDEKERLGRDLHDGLIQSLYAAGLTLESIRPLIREDPAEADRRLARTLSVLNASIADVRSFITGLKPEQLKSGGFAAALDSIVGDLRTGRDVVFDLRVDEDASGQLSAAQESESLQIVREAVSNSLRHGGADRVTIRLHRTDREICLLIQDNGGGFDPSRRREGNGLDNMRARAANVGAQLKIESKPGEGSRTIITLPRITA